MFNKPNKPAATSAVSRPEPMDTPRKAIACSLIAENVSLEGDLVSERHRSSHSSVVPPQPRTYAESTGRSGSSGPTSAALMES